MQDTDARFSTGVRFLDMELGGGIPVGDLVALTTPPGSQSETIFREIGRSQPLQYVSTICSDEDELRTWVEPSADTASGDLSVGYVPPETLLDDPSAFVEEIQPGTCLILDPVNVVEASNWKQYLAVLNALKRRLRDAESVALLNCLDDATPDNRSLTLKRADHVWQLNQTVESEELSTTLLISKARGSNVPNEAISIELAEQVRIDTSRNIA